MVSGSFYFFGQYKPAYFEADTAPALRRIMTAAVARLDPTDRLWFEMRTHELAKDLRTYAVASREHGARGVGMARRSHDAWLDDVTAALPPFPGLDYRAAVNA